MKRWKAYLIDDSILADYDNTDRKPLFLSDYERAILLSQCKQLHWLTRWQNTSKTKDEIEKAIARIELELMSTGVCADMDCNDVIDCMDSIIQSIYKTQAELEEFSQKLLNELRLSQLEKAGANIQDYNPFSPPVFYDGTQAGADKLCIALRYFLNVLRIKYGAFASANGALPFAGISLESSLIELAQELGLEALAYITPSWVFSMFSSTLVNIGANITALADNNAFDELLCCLQSQLAGAGLSYANFITAISNASNCAISPNAIIIGELLEAVVEDKANFAYIIDLLAKAHESAYSAPAPCDCIEEIDCSTGLTVIYPDSPYILPPDDRVSIVNGAIVNGAGNYNVWQLNIKTGKMSFLIDRKCVSYVQFERRLTQISGTGQIWIDFYVNGTFTRSIQASGAGGAFLETFQFNNPLGFSPASAIEMRFRTTGAIAGNIEITAIRFQIKQ